MAEGYKAGSIYVDFEVVNANASKELDRLERKLKSLKNKEKDLETQKKALLQTYKETIKAYGKESQEAEKVAKKMHNLSERERELKNNILGVKYSIQEQVKAIAQGAGDLDNLADNVDKNNKKLKETRDQAEGAAQGFTKLSGAITAVKAVLLGAAAQKLYEGIIAPNEELESNLASFEVLLGSYEKANTLVDSIINLAAKTPLTSSDLMEGSKQLLAVGVEMEDITDTLRRLGDLSLGSADKLQRLINAYGKIQTGGKATLEYLNLFTENGIPIIEELANVLGVSTQEFFKLSKAGKITAEDVNNAIKNMTSEGGKFYGMLDKQSQTFKGLSSTIKDNFEIIGREIGEETFEQLKGYLNDILDEMDRLRETGELDEIIEGWGGTIAGAVKIIGDLIKILYDFRDVIGTIITALGGAKVVFDVSTGMKALGITATAAGGPLLAVGAALAVIAVNLVKTKTEVDLATQSFQDSIDASKNLFQTYNDGFNQLKEQEAKLDGLVDSLENLANKEGKTAQEKEQLKSIIDELNGSYEGLNLKYDEENDKINRNTEDVKKYAEEMNKLKGIELNIQLGESAQGQINENDLQMRTIRERILDIQKNWDNYSWKEQFDKATELERLINQFNELKSENEALIKVRDDYLEQADEMQKAQEEEEKRLQEQAEAMKTNAERTAEAAVAQKKAIDDQAAALDSMAENIDDTVEELNYLAEILAKEGKSISLTKDETQKLIKKYPELTTQLKKAADGYTIERGAIEDLLNAKKTQEIESLNAEASKTKTVLEEAAKRIEAYGLEAESIGTLAKAQETLSRVQDAHAEEIKRIAGAYDELPEITGNTFEDDPLLSLSQKELANLSSDLKNNYIPILEAAEEINKKRETLIKQIEIGSSIPLTKKKTGGTTGTKAEESADELELRNLKYNLNMGYIAEAEYYDKLETLRDKYYANGTKQWQTYTLEITKGRAKLSENMAKAEADAYEKRLKDSYGWLEDEKFYGRINSEELIEGYERMKKYTKEYYEQGKITYERYVEAIKQLDKEIYTARKETLETENKNMSDSIKKRYDNAVDELERYYDEIDRLEEQRERQEELGELEAQARLYEKAVTKTGKGKYEDILEQIKNIKKEGEKADRELEKETKLKEIQGIYEELEASQEDYLGSIINYSEEATSKIEDMTQRINEAFNAINAIITSARDAAGSSSTVYNNNLYQTNNISDKAAGKTVIDLSAIAYGFKLWRRGLK